jgi:hypothetical protein
MKRIKGVHLPLNVPGFFCGVRKPRLSNDMTNHDRRDIPVPHIFERM